MIHGGANIQSMTAAGEARAAIARATTDTASACLGKLRAGEGALRVRRSQRGAEKLRSLRVSFGSVSVSCLQDPAGRTAHAGAAKRHGRGFAPGRRSRCWAVSQERRTTPLWRFQSVRQSSRSAFGFPHPLRRGANRVHQLSNG